MVDLDKPVGLATLVQLCQDTPPQHSSLFAGIELLPAPDVMPAFVIMLELRCLNAFQINSYFVRVSSWHSHMSTSDHFALAEI